MPHEIICRSCGKTTLGNRKKIYCNEACRKHFDRNGPMPLTGLNPPQDPDKSGQIRTTPRAGGSSVTNYALKKGVDFLFNALSDTGTPAKSPPLVGATTPTNTPLQLVTPGKSMKDPSRLFLNPKVELTDPFATFLGDLEYPFKMLVWGLPGSGKSTFCMQLANQLAAHQSITYIAGEEDLESRAMLSKIERTLSKANQARCTFTNRLPQTQDEWKKALQMGHPFRPFGSRAVFYDSVTKLGINPFYVDAVAHQFQLPDFTKRRSHIFITHAHKDGKQYRGDGSWGHEVDIVIRIEKGIASIEKNRFVEEWRTLTVF